MHSSFDRMFKAEKPSDIRRVAFKLSFRIRIHFNAVVNRRQYLLVHSDEVPFVIGLLEYELFLGGARDLEDLAKASKAQLRLVANGVQNQATSSRVLDRDVLP